MHYESVRTVGVPLIRDDKVLGVISVGRADTDVTFTAAEREVFALLGSHVALALTNAHLVEEVSALAIHDGLTGLYNRRHFDAALELAIARFKRRGPAANLAAIMFDLDHFGTSIVATGIWLATLCSACSARSSEATALC